MFILKLLILYLPIEVIFLKWLPVSEQMYSLLRQLPDFLIFSMSLVLLFFRILSKKTVPIIGGKVDLFLSLFIGWAFLTIVLNPSADVFFGIANIKALLRYILLVYIVLLLNPSEMQIRSLVSWVFIAILSQIFIATVQFIGGTSVRDILVARDISDGIGGVIKVFTGAKLKDTNDLIGTMGDTISFAYMMILGMVLWFFTCKFNLLKIFTGFVLFLAFIYLSGSRSVVLSSLLFVFGYFIWQYGFKRLSLYSVAVLPIFLSVVFVASNIGFFDSAGDNKSFWFIFNSDYIDMALNQRLGILVYIVPKLLFTTQNIIGFSPDKYYFAETVATNLPMIPEILLAVLPNVLEDVYWVAMYIYYGLAGFILWTGFLTCLYMLFNKFLKHIPRSQCTLIMIAKSLLLLSIPLNLFNQAFEVRSFSFYLWLLCALALVSGRNSLQQGVSNEGSFNS